MRMLGITSCVAVGFLALMGAVAEGQPRGGRADGLWSAWRASLVSERSEARRAALVQLRGDRAEVVAALIDIAKKAYSGAVGQFNDDTFQAFMALPEWNATGAMAMLVERVDYRVEIPVGLKTDPGVEWPAAYALSRLNSIDTSPALALRIASEASPVRRKLLAWVLHRTMGVESAVALLNGVARQKDGPARGRLLQAAKDVARGNELPSEAER